MPPWRIGLHRRAERYLGRLPVNEQRRIVAAIRELAGDPYGRKLDVTALSGRTGHRLRVGRWRVLFVRDDDEREITIVAIAARGQAYKGLEWNEDSGTYSTSKWAASA